MTPQKWEEILEMVEENFEVLNKGKEEFESGSISWIEFDSPFGRLRLEFIEKPKIIDKKTLYTTRIGSEVKVEYVYSDSEKVYEFLAYRWEEATNDWIEINADDLNF